MNPSWDLCNRATQPDGHSSPVVPIDAPPKAATVWDLRTTQTANLSGPTTMDPVSQDALMDNDFWMAGSISAQTPQGVLNENTMATTAAAIVSNQAINATSDPMRAPDLQTNREAHSPTRKDLSQQSIEIQSAISRSDDGPTVAVQIGDNPKATDVKVIASQSVAFNNTQAIQHSTNAGFGPHTMPIIIAGLDPILIAVQHSETGVLADQKSAQNKFALGIHADAKMTMRPDFQSIDSSQPINPTAPRLQAAARHWGSELSPPPAAVKVDLPLSTESLPDGAIPLQLPQATAPNQIEIKTASANVQSSAPPLAQIIFDIKTTTHVGKSNSGRSDYTSILQKEPPLFPHVSHIQTNGLAALAATTPPQQGIAGAMRPLGDLAKHIQPDLTSFDENRPITWLQSAATSNPTLAPPAGSQSTPLPLLALATQLKDHVKLGKPGLVELSLTPQELGQIKLLLTPDGDKIRIVIHAERPETMDLMRRNAESFITDLRQSGFSNPSLSFANWGDAPKGDQRQQNTENSQSQSAPFAAPKSITPQNIVPPRNGLDLRV
ncbi:hook-length control protein FliK [Pseudorhodobacter antarcticus]|uniref:Hook-length control protein FliK n=2 Tax=Pseudorhodobacter antarcticus TaxID=1077947 RepID=A0A1H8IQB8_9RHOB|nr:hook-length control protein FliK [Pseudorhodobacter antarcticus]